MAGDHCMSKSKSDNVKMTLNKVKQVFRPTEQVREEVEEE